MINKSWVSFYKDGGGEYDDDDEDEGDDDADDLKNKSDIVSTM